MVKMLDAPAAANNSPPQSGRLASLTDEDWLQMIAAMEDVVHRGGQGFRGNGTAWAYIGRGIDYRMAGKSGTAQVVEIRQGEEYNEEELSEFRRKHAWFMAFAPVDDPQIALAVLVENGGGGSSVAAPVAREVIDAFLGQPVAMR
jgi:penicillin-binding protein 2